MRVNADSLLIRAATTSTSGTLNDLRTGLIMANNKNRNMLSSVCLLLMPLAFHWFVFLTLVGHVGVDSSSTVHIAPECLVV